jgi:CRP/FNR family transcriptional regulator, cyclic AMP receptor protein
MSRRFHSHDVDSILAKIPLFADCSKKELQRVRGLLTPLIVPAGTVLITEGQPGHEFFVVLEGQASVTHNGVTIATLGPGDYFGEIALIEGGPRTATVTADEPMRVEVASEQEFRSLLDSTPGLARALVLPLARRIHALEAAEQGAGPR